MKAETAEPYAGRRQTADAAVARVRSGWRVFLGSGAAKPQALARALAKRAPDLSDAEVVHLLTLGDAPYARAEWSGNLRHNALFIGPNVRDMVRKGEADYTPCFLSEIPAFLRTGRLPVDAALIQVSPPEDGFCSLGVAVDIQKAAVEAAPYVVAQVNARMPRTGGDSLIPVSDVDAFVPYDEDLLELDAKPVGQEALWIGRYVSRLIGDGDTLQMGIGSVPDAVLAALAGKKDLGVHSEMISDGALRLWERGIATGRRKSLHPGKIVASFCMGSRRLYEAVDRNPAFEFYPSDYVNAPFVISRNQNMVSINSALQLDLTGQVGADSLGSRFYSGVGGQVDFIRGAACAPGGRSIIALPSTAGEGKLSRIVPCLSEGTGVVTTRADVDFVATEYGIASLKAKTIRERAVALIQIAHPKHRPGLLKAAKALGYLDAGHVLPLGAPAYRADLETRRRFGDRDVFFRPIKPSDERRLKELFYSQSAETTLRRFGLPLKRLSERQFQELVAVDYLRSMALAGFVRDGGRERMIAVGRYYAPPGQPLAEAAFTVHDAFQGKGIGTFLVRSLGAVAKEAGLEGFRAEVAGFNPRMRSVLERCFSRVEVRDLREDGVSIAVLFKDLRP